MNEAVAAMVGIPISMDNNFINWEKITRNLLSVMDMDSLVELLNDSKLNGLRNAKRIDAKTITALKYGSLSEPTFSAGLIILNTHFDRCYNKHNRLSIQQQ